ncbi:hypothetical protein SUNI508_09646 [Seiridium unicorne]|uniref:Uncharacterized protein n=1 Tax=Seiridium unicorne TaxID=138068 RepID=A0ABR2UPG5_9PEZI
MASPPHISAAGASSSGKGTRDKQAPYSVKNYVSGGPVSPTEHLSVGSGQSSTMKKNAEKARERIIAWDKTWSNAGKK